MVCLSYLTSALLQDPDVVIRHEKVTSTCQDPKMAPPTFANHTSVCTWQDSSFCLGESAEQEREDEIMRTVVVLLSIGMMLVKCEFYSLSYFVLNNSEDKNLAIRIQIL